MHTVHLPNIDQIVMSPERPTLVALEIMLQLATRSLLAENPTLEPKPHPRAGNDTPQLALAATAITLADTLRQVIDGYLRCLDQLYRDGYYTDPDDMPF